MSFIKFIDFHLKNVYGHAYCGIGELTDLKCEITAFIVELESSTDKPWIKLPLSAKIRQKCMP